MSLLTAYNQEINFPEQPSETLYLQMVTKIRYRMGESLSSEAVAQKKKKRSGY